MGSALVQSKRQNAARFDMAADTGIGHHGCRAEWAFRGMRRRVKLDLGGTIGAGQDPRFFQLGLGQLVGKGGVKVQFAQFRPTPGAGTDRPRVTAMVTGQRAIARIKPVIGPALVTGKTMFVVGHRTALQVVPGFDT